MTKLRFSRYLFLLSMVLIMSSDDLMAGTKSNHDDLVLHAREAVSRGIAFYHSIAIEGGYVYHYSVDLKEKWGEGRTDDRTIEVQPPGTPAVGMTFLRAYRVIGEPAFLTAAEDAAEALIRGQNDLGGWGHKIYFDRPKSKFVSFDDDQTQSAIRFLMALDQEIDKSALTTAVNKALDMMIVSQMNHGGWPHRYPEQLNYHDFATFNDGGINDCIKVMLAANQYYKRDDLERSLRKVGWFLLLSQMPPPQPGWAQQYNQYLQPAWARAFEPPAVCPLVTIRNINSLIDLYLHNGDRSYLEPIPDALSWLDSIRLPNGNWARFIEIGSGQPLYYDRGRIRVASTEELSLERSTGYGYEQDLSVPLQKAKQRFESVSESNLKDYLALQDKELTKSELEKRVTDSATAVAKVLNEQDTRGRWLKKNDRYRKTIPGKAWDGEYEIQDRISSALFNANIHLLCDYIELYERWQESH